MGKRAGTALVAAGVGMVGLAAARWRNEVQRGRTARRLVEQDPEPSRRIVVLGAGFGGLYAAIRLADEFWSDPETEVLLVDRHNYHLFTPMLTLVAASALAPRAVAYPVRRLLRDHHLDFHREEVKAIDLAGQTITTDKGVIRYDKLVLALGSVTNFFGLSEVEQFGFKFKGIADAVEIRNHIVDCFERASGIDDPEQRREWLTISLVGGGPTGVELAAAIHDFIHHTLIEEYPNLSFDDEVRIMLFEMQDRLLANHDGDFSAISRKVLEHKDVEVRLNSAIASAWEGGVRTKDGEEIPTRTLVWTAGVQANPVIKDLDVEKGRGGGIVVDDMLRVPAYPGVYAIGDNAAYTDPRTGKLLPPDAKVAIQQAGGAATNVIRELRGEEPVPFVYRHFGDMISLGTNAAVADVLGLKLTGFPAWLLWRLYYLGRLQGIENKFMVVTDWLASTVFERYTARLDLDTRRTAAQAATASNAASGRARAPGASGRRSRAAEPAETEGAGEERPTAA